MAHGQPRPHKYRAGLFEGYIGATAAARNPLRRTPEKIYTARRHAEVLIVLPGAAEFWLLPLATPTMAGRNNLSPMT